MDCLFLIRPLQIYFLRHFRPLLDPPIPLSPQVKDLSIAWSSRNFLLLGKPFSPPPPSLTLTTDASNLGWGASLPPHLLSGLWSPQNSKLHINMLELKAVFLALQGFVDQVSGHSVLVKSDNTTVVSYINHQGGTLSVPLCMATLHLLSWCRQKNIFLTASHIPGEQNLVADFLSRGKFLPSEWSLHPSVFQRIIRSRTPLSVDLFASSLNHLLPRYCTRASDPNAWAVDAFSIPWLGFLGFAFPPFPLRVLEKVALDQTALLLVVPFWPKRPWFPQLLSLLAGPPKFLPVFPGILRQPISHLPNPSSLHLTLWPLSGYLAERQAFLSELPIWQRDLSDSHPAPLMIQDLSLSLGGITTSRSIHITPL